MRSAKCGTNSFRRPKCSTTPRFSCSIDGGNSDGSQFARLFDEKGCVSQFDFSGIHKQFRPITRFVCFLFHRTHFLNEVRCGFGPTGGPVVRTSRRSGTQQLAANNVASPVGWQILDKLDDVQRKLLRSFLQIFMVHGLPFNFPVTRATRLLSLRIPHSAFRSGISPRL